VVKKPGQRAPDKVVFTAVGLIAIVEEQLPNLGEGSHTSQPETNEVIIYLQQGNVAS